MLEENTGEDLYEFEVTPQAETTKLDSCDQVKQSVFVRTQYKI